ARRRRDLQPRGLLVRVLPRARAARFTGALHDAARALQLPERVRDRLAAARRRQLPRARAGAGGVRVPPTILHRRPHRRRRQRLTSRMLDIHVISHTHWDREWYLPYEAFRLRLVALVDRLLDLLDADPSYRYFHLDGQTIVLEDYLEIRPEQEPRLRR